MRRNNFIFNIVLFITLPGILLPRALAAQNLEIYCIEVGYDDAPTFIRQGDSTLIISPAGKRMLIDGGAAGMLGADTVTALFDRVIPTGGLDYIVTTHWDQDHSDGLPDIATYNSNQYMPSTVYDLGTNEGTVNYHAAFDGIRIMPNVGDTIDLGGGCTALFVSIEGHIHGGGYIDPWSGDPDHGQNARSIGVIIRYGGFDYLTCGDLTGANPDVEGPLGAALQADGYNIDVLHVSHHGSANSTGNSFVADILPEFAVISCGDSNTYYHPFQEVINHLNTLKDNGTLYTPAYIPVKTIYLLERGRTDAGWAENAKIVGLGNWPSNPGDPTRQGSLRITVFNGGASYSFRNEGPNTNSINDGPYASDEATTPDFLVFDSGDYNGDGTSDIAVFRGSCGLWSIRGISRYYFGSSGDIPAPGDYNGDEITDIALFRSYYGTWAVRGVTRIYFGSSSDSPVPGDYDGDGCCDTGIFRESGGLWAIRNVTRAYFGTSDDRPVPGDYNGNGTKDIALFRGSSGLWALKAISRIYLGRQDDIPVPADYDGDGITETAIFRGYYGLWAIRGVSRLYFGGSSDRPVPADHNGDSADEAGLFRPSSGLWAIRGNTRAYYGTTGDIPVTR